MLFIFTPASLIRLKWVKNYPTINMETSHAPAIFAVMHIAAFLDLQYQ